MSDSSEILERLDERTEQILAGLQELKNRSDREGIKVVILALQPVVLVLIGAIAYDDG